ncbi:hypothetical protein YPPY01_4596, partial [Yersinia pestis PY-01]
MPNTAEATPA